MARCIGRGQEGMVRTAGAAHDAAGARPRGIHGEWRMRRAGVRARRRAARGGAGALDGTTLWIYQPDERQVLKGSFNAAFVSTTPVSFLAGVGRIKDDFDVAQDPRGCNAQRIYLKLVPKRAQDVGSLTLAVSRPAFDIVEAAVTDPIGNVTTLSFSNIQRNVDVPEDEFRFVVPEGVDVVTAPSGGA